MRVYFSHFISKQGTIVKDNCYRQDAQSCSVCSPSGLIYYGHANWSYRRQRPCANFLIIIMCYEAFSYFFLNKLIVNFQQENFAFWCKKIQIHLLRGVLFIKHILKTVAKIFKKYMKVNHFLLLSCSLEK